MLMYTHKVHLGTCWCSAPPPHLGVLRKGDGRVQATSRRTYHLAICSCALSLCFSMAQRAPRPRYAACSSCLCSPSCSPVFCSHRAYLFSRPEHSHPVLLLLRPPLWPQHRAARGALRACCDSSALRSGRSVSTPQPFQNICLRGQLDLRAVLWRSWSCLRAQPVGGTRHGCGVARRSLVELQGCGEGCT